MGPVRGRARRRHAAWAVRDRQKAPGLIDCFLDPPLAPFPLTYELYFERLEAADGLGRIKRPDLLLFREENRATIERCIDDSGGLAELPFVPEEKLGGLLGLALGAVECENSLWKAERMPGFGQALRLDKKSGMQRVPKTSVQPSIFLKEEDRAPLRTWQEAHGIPIHIWQVFYDRAYGIALTGAESAIVTGQVPPTKQVFQAPGGATTTKVIYKIFYQLAYEVGRARSEPQLRAEYIEDKNGHILPYVRFEGGMLELSSEAVATLAGLAEGR
ncbi:MAG: hypothetical protein ACRD1C_04775 [Terriglobales bacterium]